MQNLILLFLVSTGPAWAAPQIELTESLVVEMVAQKPPTLEQVEASFLQTKLEYLRKKDQLAFRLEGDGQVFESKERLLNQFDGGVLQNATNYSLALNKKTGYGLGVGLKVFGSKVSNAFVTDAATSGVTLSLSMDLFQNFLGRQSRNDLHRSALSLKRAELEKKASTKAFETNLRKVYWALVANAERQKLLKALVKTSEKQYKDILKKKRSGVADAGELARAQAQWNSRKSNLLSIGYERVQLVKSLKEVLPDLKGKEVAPLAYNPKIIRAEVLACAKLVASFDKTPMHFTDYDEIVGYLVEEDKLEQKSLVDYNDPTVKLVGEVSSIGRDFGLENSRQDLFDDGKPRLSLGVQVSVPLGKGKKESKKTIQALAKAHHRYQAQTNLLKVQSFHDETVNLVKILREVIKSQGNTNALLEKSLKFSKKKYNQARIGLPEIIVEQEAYFQSKLSEIDSNLTIMNILMDYFSIFIETPCKLNTLGRI